MASSGQPPTFYHILMNPSSPHLPLPVKFVKKHLKNRILKKPILKSANGGYLWKLKMKKFDDDSFCFVDGWCKVVKDVGFLFGEFLLFKYVGASVFLLHVYSVNGCEKILAPRISKFKVDDDEVSVFDDDEVSVFDDEDEDEVEEEDDDYDGVDVDVAEEDEEDEEVELGEDDDDEDDGEDEDDVDVDGDDGDPFFVITSSKRNRNKLRFPPDLVAMAKINTKETITLKNDDGYEKEMPVQSYIQNKSTRYYVAEGWQEFQQSNNISEGDECVLKFITSEDKLCLARVTKKRTRATEADNDDEGEAEDAKEDDSNVDGDDISNDDMDDEGKGENVKFVNDDEDDEDEDDSSVDGDDIFDDEGAGENAKLVNDDEDHEDDDRDTDGEDGDPSFILTSTKKNRYHLWFKADFVALAGMNTRKTITLKNPEGYEKELRLRSNKQKRSIRYFLNAGWNEFQQNSNISEGDEFVFKFIKSEDKFCVAKITKEITRASPLPPAAEARVTEVDDGMDEEGEADDAKEDDSNVDGDDIFDDDESKGEDAKLVNDDEDDEDDDCDAVGDDGDPSFILTSAQRNKYHLRFSTDFVALAGINTRKTITLKNLDGYEEVLRVRSQRGQSPGIRYGRPNRWRSYFLSAGWKEFQRNSDISEGDKFEFKFISSEDKFCVEKITEKKTPAAEAPVTEVDDGMDEAADAKADDSNVDGDDIFNDDADDEGTGENAKLVNDDEDDEDDDCDVVGNDGDPSFILTSTKKNRYHLRFSADFVALAGIHTRKTITLKNLDGYEKVLRVRSQSRKSRIVQSVTIQSRRNRLKGYFLSAGWKEFQRNSNISEGDKFVFKFITSEDKFSVAKITEGNDVTDVELSDDGNPSFVATVTPTYHQMLRMPADFTRLARLETKKTLTLKSLDGYEKEMPLRVQKSCRYYVGSGWKDILQSTSISEGDKCVFKFVASEDKLCLAKIIKKKTEAHETEFIDDDGTDDEDVEDYKKDENAYAELMDDEDPFFVVNITTSHKYTLRIPADFARLARLDTKETLTFKALDGYEKEMPLRVEKSELARYYVGKGWKDILQSTSISEGDKCVFEFIASEDKLCLVKIVKKKTQATPQLPIAEAQEKKCNDEVVEDDNDEDENEDIERVNDADPFFTVDITTSHNFMLRLPTDFVELAGIDGKNSIIIQCLDGNEIEMVLRPIKQGQSTRYCLSMGWPAFKRRNNISEGDECVFKYITREDKMSLAKVTKKITPPTEVDDGMDGKDVVADDNKDGDENVELADDGMDVDADDKKDKDKDAEFVVTITPSHKSKLRLPPDFVDLAGIDGKKNIIIKCPDGNERQMVLTPVKQDHLTRYSLSMGWSAFRRSNNISEGDECVFKYITSEDKMCLAKTTKKEARASPPPPAAETPPTKDDDNTDGDEKVQRGNDGMDDKDVNEYAKLVDGMDDRDVEFNNNNDEDEHENENVELVDDGMDDKDVDEYVKLVDGTDANEDAKLVDEKDPFFRVTIGPSHKSMLRLPPDFVELAGINTKKNIIIKSLDGNESQMDVRFDGRLKSLRYHLAKGLAAFMRRNNISQGNECVFKYITSEDKMCLAEVVKSKRGRRPPRAEKVSRRPPPAEITAAEGVKRKRGRPPSSSPRVAKDVTQRPLKRTQN